MDFFENFDFVKPSYNNLFVLITNKCNISCTHCYVNSSPHGEYGINLDKLKEIIWKSKSLNSNIKIIISGGEALVRGNDIFNLLKEFPNNQFLLLSNGMLFNDSVSKEISKFKNLSIRISIDGHNSDSHNKIRGKQSFEKVIAGIKRLQSNNFFEISISSSIDNNHVNNIPKILYLAESLKINYVKIEPIAQTGRAENAKYFNFENENKSFKEFVSQNLSVGNWIQKKIDDYKFDTITIYSNGDIYPFTFYNDIDKKLAQIGNIYIDDFIEVITSVKWKNTILQKILNSSIGHERSLGAYSFNLIES